MRDRGVALVIHFKVADQPASFRWDNITGKAELWALGDYALLQDPRNPATHVSFTLNHTWRRQFGDHAIAVTKQRPLLLAGFRPNKFTVTVDDVVVAQATGL